MEVVEKTERCCKNYQDRTATSLQNTGAAARQARRQGAMIMIIRGGGTGCVGLLVFVHALVTLVDRELTARNSKG